MSDTTSWNSSWPRNSFDILKINMREIYDLVGKIVVRIYIDTHMISCWFQILNKCDIKFDWLHDANKEKTDKPSIVKSYTC